MPKRRKFSGMDSLFVERDGALFFFPKRKGKGIPCTAVDRERVIERYRRDIQFASLFTCLTIGVGVFSFFVMLRFADGRSLESYSSLLAPPFLVLWVAVFLSLAGCVVFPTRALGRAKIYFSGRNATAPPMTAQEKDYAKRLSIAALPEIALWVYVASAIVSTAIGVARWADPEPAPNLVLLNIVISVMNIGIGVFSLAIRRRAVKSL
ncbi:MAG: hypothetical protein K2Q06_03130 [Parvularculaceae bacterium]|nr:hypothetical protein [Parvularculaceae bacterium]